MESGGKGSVLPVVNPAPPPPFTSRSMNTYYLHVRCRTDGMLSTGRHRASCGSSIELSVSQNSYTRQKCVAMRTELDFFRQGGHFGT